MYWLDDAGDGHVQLEIRRRDDETVVARTAPVPAYMTSAGFERSASTLRWTDKDTVTVVPWFSFFDSQGLLELRTGDPIEPLVVLPPVPDTATVTPVSTRVLTGNLKVDYPDELPDPGTQPWMFLRMDGLQGSGAYGIEMRRLVDELGMDETYRAWWEQVGLDQLQLRAYHVDEESLHLWPWTAGARKNGDDLRVNLPVTEAQLDGLSDVDRIALARTHLHAALTNLATARKLTPPPPLPERE